MPETRGLIWFRRAALAAVLLCAIVVVVGSWRGTFTRRDGVAMLGLYAAFTLVAVLS